MQEGFCFKETALHRHSWIEKPNKGKNLQCDSVKDKNHMHLTV